MHQDFWPHVYWLGEGPGWTGCMCKGVGGWGYISAVPVSPFPDHVKEYEISQVSTTKKCSSVKTANCTQGKESWL